MEKKQYIVVAGNIGAGKSTLVDLLSRKLNWKAYYEPVGENPYLKDFYADMSAWAYHSQMFFLADRLEMHRRLQHFSGSVVQDRSVYEDANIFARNLARQGYIDDRDFHTYWKFYELIVELLGAPDLIVYLEASVPTLKKRIALRGREFEKEIPASYLEQLNELYDEWIRNWSYCPVLSLDMNRIDVRSNPSDIDRVSERVIRALSAGQEELFLP